VIPYSGRETITRVTGGMKVKADRDESSPYAAMVSLPRGHGSQNKTDKRPSWLLRMSPLAARSSESLLCTSRSVRRKCF
jgi:hypothetical protein